ATAAISRRPNCRMFWMVVYGMEVMSVTEADADEDRRELGVFSLIGAEVAAHAAFGVDAVLRIEPGVVRPRMEVAGADSDRESIGAQVANGARRRIEGECHLAQLREVRRP